MLGASCIPQNCGCRHDLEAACVQDPGEEDAAGMARILGMPAEQLQAKRAVISTLLEDLYIQNRLVVDSILQAVHRNINVMNPSPVDQAE